MMDIFTLFPTLHTPRFFLRQIRPSDREAIYQCFAHEEVTRYYDQPTYTSYTQAEALIGKLSQSYYDQRAIRWGIARREDDWLVGTCGYHGWMRPYRRAEVGYELARPYWGQGIMTEVLTAVLDFGFSSMNLNRIEAFVMPGNAASLKVLAKMGFAQEGTLRQYAYFKGAFYDLIILSRLRETFIPI